MDDVEEAKRRAAKCAAETIENDQVVGLGGGTTAAYAIRALGRRVAVGLDIEGVPMSYQSRAVAKDAGIPLREPEDVETVDVAIDGADQVAGDVLVKGGGGAHAREKLVDGVADELLIVVDDRKIAERIDEPVPLDILPSARSIVARRIRDLDGEPELRQASEKAGPVITDNGTMVLDCDFGVIEDPAALAETLDGLAGVLEHGLFVGFANTVYVGGADGVTVR